MDVLQTDVKPTESEKLAAFEAEFIAGLESEDDFAARDVLAAGRPIYYVDSETPPGLLIKEHPDGRRQLVRHARNADEVVKNL